MLHKVSSSTKSEPSLDSYIAGWNERDILAEAETVGQIGSWAWDLTSDRLWWSDETYRICGLEPQSFEVTSDAFLAMVHPDDRRELDGLLRMAVSSAGSFRMEHRLVRPDGEIRHVDARGRVALGPDGRPERMLGLVRDVTEDTILRRERDAALKALTDSEERYRLLAENAWDVIWTMGVDGTITYVSPSVERVRGFTPAEAAAQTLDQIHPPDSAQKVTDYFAALYAAIAEGTVPPIYRGEREYYRKDGSLMIGELQVIPQVDEQGLVVQILGVTRDISERRQFELELNRLAVTDPLTGVWNRRQGEKLFGADLAEARRYGPPLSLLMLDIDHFKHTNDTYGHQIGDLVLIELTKRISENLRTSDVLARWGGEEFVILLRHCSVADAGPLAEKIRTLVADTPFEEVGDVTVSIGAAELGPDDDLASWLDRADQAMYAAKSEGRNQVRISR